MPGPLVPADDLYARLGLEPEATPEAIELAWRALLRRHHPDVAGDSAAALETVVDLESDRMRSLRIDDGALEQEREVVKEERRLRTDN
ncbi:MAG: DnaJ domain-containing protein, partial [Chloroflexota bacterium]